MALECPIPVRLQAPIRPSVRSFSKTGRTWEEQRQRCQPTDVRSIPHRMLVGRDVEMQEEDVQALSLKQAEAGFDGLAQYALNPIWRGIAEVALAGDWHIFQRAATEGLTDNPFRVPVAIPRNQVRRVGPGRHGSMHSGDTSRTSSGPRACQDHRRRGSVSTPGTATRICAVAWTISAPIFQSVAGRVS